jgi:hypothetical protein
MSVSSRHILSQAPVIASLVRTVIAARRGAAPGAAVAAPGPWIEAELPPRPPDLVRDYIRHVGGDPSAYRGVVPAHFFPQWGFPLAARTLVGLPYPLARALNAGCRLESRLPLPAGEPLHVRARLESLDDDGRRAILGQTVITGTRSAPEAVVAEMRVFVPLAGDREPGRGNGERRRKPPVTVPPGLKEILFTRVRRDAGLDFAKLTGDFNPVHWIPAYARAAGQRSVILHGFSTMARAAEAVVRRVLSGDPSRLETLEARFTGPLVLPAEIGVYVGDGGALYVGDAPAGRAFLEGHFTIRKERAHG